MPKNILSATMSRGALVHATKGLPAYPALTAGFVTYGPSGLAPTPCLELQKGVWPASYARRTLHFAVSQVAPTHSAATQSLDTAVIIPLSNLPQSVLQKFIGNPEDVFLFTHMLNLRNVGATLLVPESRVAECKSSYAAKILKHSLKCVSYPNHMSISEAFIAYATKHSIPYLLPEGYLRDGDADSTVTHYKIVDRDRAIIESAEAIYRSIFRPNNFFAEHALHPLAHLEVMLDILTRSYIHMHEDCMYDDSAIDFQSAFNVSYALARPHQDGLLLYDSYVELLCAARNFITGPGRGLYHGPEELYDAFQRVILSLAEHKTFADHAKACLEYKKAVYEYIATQPDFAGVLGDFVPHYDPSDGQTVWNYVGPDPYVHVPFDTDETAVPQTPPLAPTNPDVIFMPAYTGTTEFVLVNYTGPVGIGADPAHVLTEAFGYVI